MALAALFNHNGRKHNGKHEPPHCRKERKRNDDHCKRRLKKDCHKPRPRKNCR